MTKATKLKAVKATEARACAKCGASFSPLKAWQRFCSEPCRVNAHQSKRYADSKKATKALRLIVRDLEAGNHDAALKRARAIVGA